MFVHNIYRSRVFLKFVAREVFSKPSMFRTLEKTEDQYGACLFGVVLIIACTCIALGLYLDAQYTEYENNSSYATMCDIFNISTTNCTENDDGIRYILQAMANTTDIDSCEENENIVKYESECNEYPEVDINSTTLLSCWISRDCEDIFYLSNNYDKPKWNKKDSEMLMIIGAISLGVGIVYVWFHLIAFKMIKRCFKKKLEPSSASSSLTLTSTS